MFTFALITLLMSMLFSPSDILTNLVIISFLIAAAIVAIWYIIGALLNNEKVKSGAKSEFYQLVGTAIMIGIIIAILYFFATSYTTAVAFNNGYKDLYSACSSLQNGNLYIIQQTLSAPVVEGDNICSLISSVSSSQTSGLSITSLADIPMASTVVLTSSLAEQIANNFNDTFYLDGWLGFLSKLQSSYTFCSSEPGTAQFGAGCMADTASVATTSFITPYAGFDLIYKGIGIISILLMTELAVFTAQLIFENIFIYIWPYLLFLGIIFRATIFTRKLGGLMIALALGAIIVYPSLFTLEYTATNYLTSKYPQTISFCNGGYTYTENFSHMPSVASIATACQCYPTHGLFGEEVDAITGSLAGFGLLGNGVSFINLQRVGMTCTVGNYNFLGVSGLFFNYGAIGTSEETLFNLMSAYGFIGVIGYFIPIINILITINAIIGFSGILGGDTQLAGLARLI
ncbi:MAG: hypothetical protein ACP5RQ_02095 [Candidatus Micrarchaeia archaeon]